LAGNDLKDESAPYAMFSRKEMNRRYARAQAMMAELGLDALLITGEANLQYFIGTSATLGLYHSLTRPSAFILPSTGRPLVITQDKDSLEQGCYIEDIRVYYDVLRFRHELVVQALTEIGLHNRRVGVELGQEQRMGIPTGAFLEIESALADVAFVDAADLVIRLRMVKSEDEIAYMERAADITARARQRLYAECIAPGVTERDVARHMRRLILEEGGDNTSFVLMMWGPPGSMCEFHYERPLVRGTVLSIDTGAYCGMYTVDYNRSAVLGKASLEQRRLHDTVRRINAEMVRSLRPGLACSELYQIAMRAIADAGVEPLSEAKATGGGRFGHGQGILLTEPPSVNPFDHTELSPGMVICTEPGIRYKQQRFSWEDIHVITEDGHRQITRETDELIEIPFD
jgi:Xaa-Pro aminopeptidase